MTSKIGQLIKAAEELLPLVTCEEVLPEGTSAALELSHPNTRRVVAEFRRALACFRAHVQDKPALDLKEMLPSLGRHSLWLHVEYGDPQRANFYDLRALLAELPREQLREILKGDAEPWADDETTPEDADIAAAFPTCTGLHALYAEAMRLVGARRSKGALVALVNWLLAREDKLKERVASLEGGIVAENKRVELEEEALAQAVTLVNEARSVVFDLRVVLEARGGHMTNANARAEDWCRRAQEFDILHGKRS